MKYYYFDAKNWNITLDKRENAVRLHPVTMLLLAPMLGATLVLFLPFIGIGLIFWYALIVPVMEKLKKDVSNEKDHPVRIVD